MAEPDRDPEVSRGYRALDGEAPPRTLDESILAAARSEVEVHPAPLVAPTQRRHWYVPLAAAAVIVLSVVVTLNMERGAPDFESLPRESVGRPSIGEPVVPKAASREAVDAPAEAPAARAASAAIRTDSDRDRVLESGPTAPGLPASEAPPLAWLERIAELRRAGREIEADQAYAAFRRRYPEYAIPEPLREQVLPRAERRPAR